MRFAAGRGGEGKGNIRACVCEIHAEDIPSDEKWGEKAELIL